MIFRNNQRMLCNFAQRECRRQKTVRIGAGGDKVGRAVFTLVESFIFCCESMTHNSIWDIDNPQGALAVV